MISVNLEEIWEGRWKEEQNSSQGKPEKSNEDLSSWWSEIAGQIPWNRTQCLGHDQSLIVELRRNVGKV